jgi:hypothetical protein
MALGEA